MNRLCLVLMTAITLLTPKAFGQHETSEIALQTVKQTTSPSHPRHATIELSDAALERLARQVQTMVDREEIVGGELLIVQNRQTLLRRAFGWKDREGQVNMEVDAVYCVRSMTKPILGTAIQMLIDEGQLALETPVHQILPDFDGPQTRAINVGHLLMHTAGFPFSTIKKPLSEYADLNEVAAEAAARPLLFVPGSGFNYSDASADILGAMVAAITGVPVELFIQKRILDPLKMKDSFTLLASQDQALARIPSAYSGGTGAWEKHWDPTDAPIFPLFLPSQSLYATTTDYARFLSLWLDAGHAGTQRLLSAAAVDRALKPHQAMSHYPANFDGLGVYYGQQWMVYAKNSEDGAKKVVIFGHGGSDGTHAWAWPELDLMVLFFTQSRGTLAGLGLERELQNLVYGAAPEATDKDVQLPKDLPLDELAGLYWDETAINAYYVISPQGDGLRMERPGRLVEFFKPCDVPGRFCHGARSDSWIEFLRADGGAVTAMRTSFAGRIEHDAKHTPVEGLPAVSDVVELVTQTHGMDRISALGLVRLSGEIKLESRGMEGSIERLFDQHRDRIDVRFGSLREVTVNDGHEVWVQSPTTGAESLEGARREQAMLDRLTVAMGDWTQHYDRVEVLKRIDVKGRSILLVRVVPREGLGATMLVDESNGLVRLMDSFALVPGIGMVGVQTRFDDFRDVGGMQIPFKIVSRFASKMIGNVVVTIDSVETHVTLPHNPFAVPLNDVP